MGVGRQFSRCRCHSNTHRLKPMLPTLYWNFMLVVMEEGAPESQTQKVIDRLVTMGFTVHRSTAVTHTLLVGVGPVADFDPAEFEFMAGVKECHIIVSPYKLASRQF